MHGFIQVLVQAHKSILTPLICSIKNKPLSGKTLLMPIHAYCCQECEGTPSGLFGNQWYKNYALATPYISIQMHVFLLPL